MRGSVAKDTSGLRKAQSPDALVTQMLNAAITPPQDAAAVPLAPAPNPAFARAIAPSNRNCSPPSPTTSLPNSPILRTPCKPSMAFTILSPNSTFSSSRTASLLAALPSWPTSPASSSARSQTPKRMRQSRSLARKSSHCLCLLVKLKFWFKAAPLPPCFYERVRTQLKTVELSFALALKPERRERGGRQNVASLCLGEGGGVRASYENIAQRQDTRKYILLDGTEFERGGNGRFIRTGAAVPEKVHASPRTEVRGRRKCVASFSLAFEFPRSGSQELSRF